MRRKKAIVNKLYIFSQYWKRIILILFHPRNKIYVVCHPVHPNLGDQAQLMCTDKWLKENYPEYKIIYLGSFIPTLTFCKTSWLLMSIISSLFTILILKIRIRKNDIFIGHSGYFFVDHHIGYRSFIEIIKHFPNNKFIILPQTVNFYCPYVKNYVHHVFLNKKNITLLCRDKVSYDNSQTLFPDIKLLLYPDIVTSLIGNDMYKNHRDGILFCMRDDIEAYYKCEDIDKLIAKFGDIRKEKIDTTLHGLSTKYMDKNRETIINDIINKIATYKVVITDRYHGTIFSAIASTPVIVINSADHKLSSGVNWFNKDIFGDNVQFANNLDDAFEKAMKLLYKNDRLYNNPPFFKENYWNKLKKIVD